MGKGGFSRAPLPWWPTGGRNSGGAVHGNQPAREGQRGRSGAAADRWGCREGKRATAGSSLKIKIKIFSSSKIHKTFSRE